MTPAMKKEKEQSTTRVMVAGKAPPAIRDAIKELAEAEERSFSFMLARLLEESPRVREKLRRQAA